MSFFVLEKSRMESWEGRNIITGEYLRKKGLQLPSKPETDILCDDAEKYNYLFSMRIL